MNRKRTVSLTIVVALLATVLWLVAAGAQAQPQGPDRVEIEGDTFYISITGTGPNPAAVTMTVGSTAVWTNDLSETVHLVAFYRVYLPLVLRGGATGRAQAAGTAGGQAASGWGDVYIAPGEAYSYTFTATGMYRYRLEGRGAEGRVNVRPLESDAPALMWATGAEGVLLRWRWPHRDPQSGRPAPQPLYYNVYRDGILLSSQPISRVTDSATAIALLGDHWPWLRETYQLNTIADLHAFLDENRLAEQWLADQRFPVALVRGLGFLDDSVLPGDPTAHTYQVEAVMAHGTESVGTVTVQNQGATPLTPPATVTATVLISPALRRSPDWVLAQQNRKAHGRIFLLWSLPQAPAGQPTPDRWVTSYDIFRAGPVGPGDDPGAMRYDQINEEPVAPMADYDPPSPVAGDVYTVPYQHYPYYFADADAALQPCQTYAYRVAPRDLLGQVAQTSGYVTATVPDAMPPEPPTLLTPTVNHLGGEISIAWQPVSDAVRYRLYRSDTPTAGWPGLTNCAVYSCWMTMTTTAGTSWVDSSALYEHRYWYVVRAEDQPCPGDPPNLSAPSNAVSAVLHDRVPPGPPTNISVTEADIRWTPDPDTDYSLLYCSFDDDPGDGQEPEKVLIAEVPSTTVHFDLASFYTAPVPVDTRCWLQPLDAHGNAGDLTLLTQSPVDICQSSVVYTLTAPVILSLTTQAGGVYSWTAAVSWDMADDLPRLQGFHVYRQEGGAARQDISGPLSPQTRRFEDLTVKPGFLYTYTVAAVLAPGCAQEFPRYVFSSPRLFRVNPTLDCCSRSVRDLVWLQHGFTPGGGTYLQWSDPQGYTIDKPVLAIVYRSLKADGDYVAITSPFVTHTNEYLDRDAEHGEYWYVVTMLDWASGEIIAQTPPWSAQSLAPLPGPTAFRSAPPAALPAAPFGPAGAGRPSALGPAAVNDVTVLAPAADTFVARGSPDTNFGSSSQLSLTDSTEVLASRYVLLRFDLSSIPAGSIIDSADLGLDLQDVGTGTVPVGLRRVTNSWVENEVTWNSQPAVDGVYVTTTVGLTTGWYTWTVTNLVQQWVYTPTTYPNYGLQLRGPAGDYEKTFSSREGSQPPRLRVGYFAPPQTLFFGVQGDNLFEVTNVTYDAGSTPWCLSGSGQVALGGPPLSTFTRTVTFSCIQAGFGDGIVTQGTATVTLSGPLQIVYPGGHVYTVTSLYMNEQTGWGDIDLVIPAATVLHHGGSAYRHVTLSPAETVRQNLTYEAHRDWTSACSQPTPTYYFEMNPLPLRIVPLGPVTFTQQTIEMGSACTQYEERYAQSRPPYPLADANDGYLRVVYTSTAAVHLFGDGVAGAFQTGEPISYTTAMPYGFEIEAADGATFEIMGNRIDNGMLLNISLAFDYYGKPAPETLTGGGISVPAPDQRFVGAADHLNIEADGALSGTIDAGANPPWPIQWAGGGFVLQERYYQLYLPPIQTAADRLPAEEAAANRPGNANIQAGLNLVGADVAFTWYHCKGACGAGATAISFPEGVSADIYVRRGGVSDHIDAVISPGSGVPVLLYGYQHTLKRFQLSFCDNYIYDSGVEADLYLPFPSAMTVPLVEMQIDPNTACMEGGRVRGDANPLTPAYWQVDIHARGVAYRPSGQCNRYLWILGAVDIPHLAPPGAQGASPVPLEISFNPDGTFHDTRIVYNKAGYKFDGFSYLLSQVRLSDYSQREQPAWTAAATLSDPPSSSVWQNHGFVELKGKTLTPVFGEIKGKGGQASPRLFVLGWDEYVGFAQQPTVQRTWTALTDITWRFDLIYAQHVVTATPRGAFVGFGNTDFKVLTLDRALVLNSWVETGTVRADLLLGLSAGTGALRALAETRGMEGDPWTAAMTTTMNAWASRVGVDGAYVGLLHQIWLRYGSNQTYAQTTTVFDALADAQGDAVIPDTPTGGGTTGDLDTWGVQLKKMRGVLVWTQDANQPNIYHFEELRISLWLDVQAPGDSEPLAHADRLTFYITRDGDYVLQGKGIKSKLYENKLESADFIVAINVKKPTFEASVTLYKLEIESIVAEKAAAVLGVGNNLFYLGALVDNAHPKYSGSSIRLGGAFLFGLIDPNSQVLKNGSFSSILKDIGTTGATDSQGRLAGGYTRVYGEMPIYDYDCVFRVSVGGEIAAWYFAQATGPGCDLYGGRLRGYVYGKVLCIVSARGDLSLKIFRKASGGQCAESASMSGKFWVAGGIGFCDPEDWTSWESRWWGDSACWTAGAMIQADYNDTTPDDWAWVYDTDYE